MVDDEGPSRISRSLLARLRRKEQVARGEKVAETLEEEKAAESVPAPDPTAESEEDAALDDDQLLQKYGLNNPEEIEDEAGLEAFMENGLPDRLRQMAFRRMWRLNPLFRFADEMVEYGENYTDAATVIEGMTTAYQVGKGYLQKAFDALDDEEGDSIADGLPASDDDQAVRLAMEDDPKKEGDKAAIDEVEQAVGNTDESAAVQASDTAENEPPDDVQHNISMAQGQPQAEELERPRPQRMTFRKSSS